MPCDDDRVPDDDDIDVPTEDHFAAIDLDARGGVEEALELLLDLLESGDYLQWEAVVCQEKGMDLTDAQERALQDLVAIVDEDEDVLEDDRILYINEIARPSEPWFESARRIVPHLLVEPFDTVAIMSEELLTGWPRLAEALETHATDLSLPEGAARPIDVFPADLQHRLWLQTCFDELGGLGQDDELTLANGGQHWRVDGFIEALGDHKESVTYFGLSLEALLQRTVMPAQDKEILTRMMMERLGLPSAQAPLAEVL